MSPFAIPINHILHFWSFQGMSGETPNVTAEITRQLYKAVT